MISKNLRFLLIEKKMTYRQLEDKSKVSKSTIDRIIRTNNCTLSNAIKIAKALGVTLDYLTKK